MARSYSVHKFDEAGPVALGGVAAAYEAAAGTLGTIVPAEHRLIQLTEVDRQVELDAVKVTFVALVESF